MKTSAEIEAETQEALSADQKRERARVGHEN
jgi:hypothetical protein